MCTSCAMGTAVLLYTVNSSDQQTPTGRKVNPFYGFTLGPHRLLPDVYIHLGIYRIFSRRPPWGNDVTNVAGSDAVGQTIGPRGTHTGGVPIVSRGSGCCHICNAPDYRH